MQIELARKIHAEKGNSIASICNMKHISQTTLHRYLKQSWLEQHRTNA